jgi:hypothetical protein
MSLLWDSLSACFLSWVMIISVRPLATTALSTKEHASASQAAVGSSRSSRAHGPDPDPLMGVGVRDINSESQ